MAQFINTANALGIYNEIPTGLTSTITIQLVEGLTLTKTADKLSWADGLLTFTLTIENTSDETYEGVKITDKLDITKIELVENSVMMGDVPVAYEYNEATGELVIIPDASLDVEAGETVTITFQVQKATTP